MKRALAIAIIGLFIVSTLVSFSPIKANLMVPDDIYDQGINNNVPENATEMGNVTTVKCLEHLVCLDVDWYNFTMLVTGNQTSKIQLLFNQTLTSITAELYDNNGTTLIGSSQATSGGCDISLNSIGPGTFKIKVQGSLGGSALTVAYGPSEYSLSVIINGRSGGPDRFGYKYIDSNCPNGPQYDWIELLDANATEILPNSDDGYVDNIDLGFFFNFYGTDYSHLSIGNNGLLFTTGGSYQYTNEPINQSQIHGFIAPFWDDIVTWYNNGTILYKTIGESPNSIFVVEWYNNEHYSSSTLGITFEAILFEGTNYMLFQYHDVDFGAVSGATTSDRPPYSNGGSATVGIESPTGIDGLQYSYNQQFIIPGLAILFKFPAFSGTNLVVTLNAPVSIDRGNTMTYTIYYNNYGNVAAQNTQLELELPPTVEFQSATGAPELVGNTVGYNLGVTEVFPNGRGSQQVTVLVPSGVPIGTVLQATATMSTTSLETRYDDNTASTSTSVTGTNLPPNTGVYPTLGNSGGEPTVYWTTPITFSYYDASAYAVDINIHFVSGGADINGAMGGGPPNWTYTTTFYPRCGRVIVTYTPHYPNGSTGSVNFGIYVDPAGYVYDLTSDERVPDATVWLQRPDGEGGWVNVPTGENPAVMQPDINPQITNSTGQYQWDTLPGSYRVHVEAQGYLPNNSIIVTVPPPVTDLHVGLTRNDSTPPTTTMSIGAGKYVSAETTYVNSNVAITFSVTDAADGIGVFTQNCTAISVRNATYTGAWSVVPNGATTLSSALGDGLYSIDFNSSDRFGNRETTNTQQVYLDNTAPSTTNNCPQTWLTAETTVTLSSTDSGSGVASTYYKLNGGATKTVAANGQPTISTESSDNVLQYWSTDNLNNAETQKTVHAMLDLTNPTGSIIINGGASTTTSTSVTLTLTAADAISGVSQIRLSNDATWDTELWESFAASRSWTLSSGDGAKTVYYQVKDTAGRLSQTYTSTITLQAPANPTPTPTSGGGTTATPTPAVNPTPTPSPTATATPTPTITATPTATPTSTPQPTDNTLIIIIIVAVVIFAAVGAGIAFARRR